ncbi:MAG: GNAT family N-acetyltransferase [Rhodospirillaceae bacterium]|nr:GNAT family N-acetyltransferase [Rhodospirillaceae bacterium]
MVVRDATGADQEAVRLIYNRAVLGSTATFDFKPRSEADQARWFAAKTEAGFPVLVAERDRAVLGFSSYGGFRSAWPGYRHTIEHSLYVAETARRQGVGRHLLAALIERARTDGHHVMVGGIDAANEASLRLHESLGFERVGLMPEVGRKFGRWLDLVLMQRWLDAPGTDRSD